MAERETVAPGDRPAEPMEEAMHAFKGSLGTILLSLEVLRRRVPADDARAQFSISAIERSLRRLDSLAAAMLLPDRACAMTRTGPANPIRID